jgi:hypothetical protein
MPFRQRFPLGQALPQLPQFAESFCVSTHVVGVTVGHGVSGNPQVTAHCPAVQRWPAAQAVPALAS